MGAHKTSSKGKCCHCWDAGRTGPGGCRGRDYRPGREIRLRPNQALIQGRPELWLPLTVNAEDILKP